MQVKVLTNKMKKKAHLMKMKGTVKLMMEKVRKRLLEFQALV